LEFKLNFKAHIKNFKNLTPPKFRKFIKGFLKNYRRTKNWIYFSILKKEISKNEITNALLILGVQQGDTILVHSSLSRLGKIEGGSSTVVNALKDAVGPEGTIGAPTFWGLTKNYLSGQRNFDVANTPSILGAVTEKIRTQPESKRSFHPTHSLAFIGPNADFLTNSHHKDNTPFGPHSPYVRMIELKGKILLLGVTIEYMTSLHTIEDQIKDFPVNVYRKDPISFNVIAPNRKQLVVSTYIHNSEVAKIRNSLKLEPFFENIGLIKKCKIGIGTARLIDASELHETLLKLYESGITMYKT
jgi:aminoglycoside 3-N-acetyltransferase